MAGEKTKQKTKLIFIFKSCQLATLIVLFTVREEYVVYIHKYLDQTTLNWTKFHQTELPSL